MKPPAVYIFRVRDGSDGTWSQIADHAMQKVVFNNEKMTFRAVQPGFRGSDGRVRMLATIESCEDLPEKLRSNTNGAFARHVGWEVLNEVAKKDGHHYCGPIVVCCIKNGTQVDVTETDLELVKDSFRRLAFPEPAYEETLENF